jgi:hypothetical protein
MYSLRLELDSIQSYWREPRYEDRHQSRVTGGLAPVLRYLAIQEALKLWPTTPNQEDEYSHSWQGADDVISQIEETLSSHLSKGIMTSQPAEARDYLLRHPDMVDLLSFVSKRTSERFGTSAQLSLEVYRDPEIRDEYLCLYVRQENYDEHIMDIIENIRAEYEEEISEKSGWLLVTTDFRPPK